MLRVEFHCHTVYSRDCLVNPSGLIEACRRKNIDRIVITDHNTIDGALKAKEIDYRRVIIGEEILTTEGELLAAFVTNGIPPGLTPEEVIDRLRAQEAFISVSHPFDITRHGWRLENLLRILPLVDAIEVFNSRCLRESLNRDASFLAVNHSIPGTTGSDAHSLYELGQALLILPEFSSAAELRKIIAEGKIEARLSPPWVHLISRYAVWRKKLGLNQL